MTIATNEGHEFQFNVVKQEESDMWKRLHIKELKKFVEETHAKIQEFMTNHLGTMTTLQPLISAEENDLSSWSPELSLEDVALRWRSEDRVTRFSQLKHIIKEAHEINIKIARLVRDCHKQKILESDLAKEFITFSTKLNKNTTFFIMFLSVYERTHTAAQVVEYIKKLEDHHSKPRGTITIHHLNRQLKALHTSIEELHTKSKELFELLKKILNLLEELAQIPEKMQECEKNVYDMEIKLGVFEKWLAEFQAGRARSLDRSEMFFLEKKVEHAKLSLDNIGDVRDASAKTVEEILEVLIKAEDLKVLEEVVQTIKKKVEKLRERINDNLPEEVRI